MKSITYNIIQSFCTDNKEKFFIEKCIISFFYEKIYFLNLKIFSIQNFANSTGNYVI